MRSLEKSSPQAFTAQIAVNPWPFFWIVVSAWIWYGALHLAHII